MANGTIPQHISRQYDNDLEHVRTRVLGMGGLVEQQLIDALRALTDSNPELGEEVLKNEFKVNSLEVAIDEECTNILARRQPAAGDLRLVMAVAKTITDLERVGDESEKIAKMAIDLSEKQGPREYYIGISSMGNFVRRMVHDALDAFARMDSQAALAVARKEPTSDDQYDAIMRQLITYMMEDPRNIGGAMDAIWVARAMERIGDHARNICESVIYFVEGKDVRHISFEEIEDKLRTPR
ncbi:MAG: phosphate transport system regulatory protein PhoU [Gammaproteobacteria bacterium RIFCSPLOWO2_02_FULL_61_13]|nr:MAG: phosphate transport system regulatory protein PhoU [Gammaproteobacteria bacterium RIFCSPLOWO2_02_FULL_61_13]